MDLYLRQRERVACMQTYIHSAALPVFDRDLYTKLLCRWTSIFGRDRVECIDICISYHPAPARYMSVFKHTETRHISCGTRMSTYAEPDVDSVDWSKGSVKKWSFHETPLRLTKRTGLRNTFKRNFRPCVPIWKTAKERILLESINRFLRSDDLEYIQR